MACGDATWARSGFLSVSKSQIVGFSVGLHERVQNIVVWSCPAVLTASTGPATLFRLQPESLWDCVSAFRIQLLNTAAALRYTQQRLFKQNYSLFAASSRPVVPSRGSYSSSLISRF